MKKTKLVICLMLSVLCMATWGCSSGNNDNNTIFPYNGGYTPGGGGGGGGGTTTSLNGAVWRYDQGTKLSALIEFASQRFTVSVTEYGYNPTSYQRAGSYAYDGEVLEFTYDDVTYKLWCSVKANGNTLAGTKWISETYTLHDTITGSLNLFADGSLYAKDFLCFWKKGGLTTKEFDDVFYTYDGETIEFTEIHEGTASLKCGRILYEMSRAKSDY